MEKGTPGYNAKVMTGKASLRAVWQAEIDLDDVRVPAENRLPGANSLQGLRPGPDRHPQWPARGWPSAMRSPVSTPR